MLKHGRSAPRATCDENGFCHPFGVRFNLFGIHLHNCEPVIFNESLKNRFIHKLALTLNLHGKASSLAEKVDRVAINWNPSAKIKTVILESS